MRHGDPGCADRSAGREPRARAEGRPRQRPDAHQSGAPPRHGVSRSRWTTFPARSSSPVSRRCRRIRPGRARFRRGVRPAASPEAAARAAQHLKEAIRHYEAALKLAPDNLTARLGHGWVLQQSGDTPERHRRVPHGHRAGLAGRAEDQGADAVPAIVHSGGRRVPHPASRQGAGRGGDRRPAREAARTSPDVPRAITPDRHSADRRRYLPTASSIALARSASTPTALDRASWTWITPDAGWLVYDAADRGTITSALQWFGERDVLVVLVERLRADARARRRRRRRARRSGAPPPRDLARPQSRRRLGRGRSAAARRAWHRRAVVQLRRW